MKKQKQHNMFIKMFAAFWFSEGVEGGECNTICVPKYRIIFHIYYEQCVSQDLFLLSPCQLNSISRLRKTNVKYRRVSN